MGQRSKPPENRRTQGDRVSPSLRALGPLPLEESEQKILARYMEEAGEHALLSKAEEQALGKEMEKGSPGSGLGRLPDTGCHEAALGLVSQPRFAGGTAISNLSRAGSAAPADCPGIKVVGTHRATIC